MKTAFQIIQRQYDWISIKRNAAERLGYDEANQRYFQRQIALNDALFALSMAGMS